MPRRLAIPRCAAFLHADSKEIEDVITGGFDDWHADLDSEDEKEPEREEDP